jgi:hypothetical protein
LYGTRSNNSWERIRRGLDRKGRNGNGNREGEGRWSLEVQAPPSFSSLVTRGPTPTMTDILHGELGTAQDKVKLSASRLPRPSLCVFFVVARKGEDLTATYSLCFKIKVMF